MTREELYEKVWSAPSAKVAKQLNVSYPKLKSICEKWNIPMPDNSYWAYLRYGTQMQRPPLPEYDGPLTFADFFKERVKDRPVIATSLLDGSETYFSSVAEAQLRFQSASQSIYNAAQYNRKHKNFMWRWAETDEKPKESQQIEEDIVSRFEKTLKELHSLFYMMMARENEERKS